MKILMFYQYFTIPQGSYSTRIYEFTRRWAKAGDEVTIITSVYDKSGITPKGMIDHFTIEGVHVRMINIGLSNKHGFLLRVSTFAAYALLACWYALTCPADVVLCSSGPLTVGIPGLVARYCRFRPMVFEVRDLWPEGAIQLGMLRSPLAIKLSRWLEERCYRGSYRVIALSEGMADWIVDAYGYTDIDIITNASDNELVASIKRDFVFPSWTKGKSLVLYTGSIGLMDDCNQILEIAARFLRQGKTQVEFVVAGEGKERVELEQRARDLHLDNVHFLGSRPKPEVIQWLLAARCALYTTKNVALLDTGSPNKMFDAFSAGAPVVQTTQGWMKRLIEREGCGLTVTPEDYDAMAQAVNTILNDDPLHARMSANATRVAHEFFDRSLLARRYRTILLNAVAGAPMTPYDRSHAIPGTPRLSPVLVDEVRS